MKISPAVAQRIPRSSLELVQQSRCSPDNFALDPEGLEAHQAAQDQAKRLQLAPGDNALAIYRGAALAESRARQDLREMVRFKQDDVEAGCIGLSSATGAGLSAAALSPLIIGAAPGWVGPVIGTVVGAITGAVVGHKLDEGYDEIGGAFFGSFVGGAVGMGAGFAAPALGSAGKLAASFIAGGLMGGMVGGTVASCYSDDITDWANNKHRHKLEGRLEQAQDQKALVQDLLEQVVEQGPLPAGLESDMLEAKIAGLLSSPELALQMQPLKLSQAQELPRAKVLAAAQDLGEIQSWNSDLTRVDPQAPPLQKQLSNIKGQNALEMIKAAQQQGGPVPLLLQATVAALAQRDGREVSLPALAGLPASENLAALEARTDQLAREAVDEVLDTF